MVSYSDLYNFMCLYNLRCGSVALETYISNQKYVIKLPAELKKFNIKTDYEFNERSNNADITLKMCKSYNLDFRKYFSFTTIRNPWAKLVSFYFYLRPDKNFLTRFDSNYDKITCFNHNFNEWFNMVKEIIKSNPAILDKYKIEHYAFDKDNNQLLTKIYRIEDFSIKTLKEDVKNYNNANGRQAKEIDFIGDIEQLNVTYHKHYSNYYSVENIEAVKEIFKKDIEIGNYCFEYCDKIPLSLQNNNSRILTSKGWINNDYLNEAQQIYDNRHIFIEEVKPILSTELWPICGLKGVDYLVANDCLPSKTNIISSSDKSEWRLFVFISKGKVIENAKHCPKTTEFLLNNSNRIRGAAFSILEPGAKVDLHTDKNTEPRNYRIHIPLILPDNNKKNKDSILTMDEALIGDLAYFQLDDDYRIWKDEEYFVAFHDHLHGTFNNTNQIRVVMFVDIYV